MDMGLMSGRGFGDFLEVLRQILENQLGKSEVEWQRGFIELWTKSYGQIILDPKHRRPWDLWYYGSLGSCNQITNILPARPQCILGLFVNPEP